MPSTQIKICGITRLEDALYATQCGVQWLGFNFVASSKRYIAPEQAAQITKQLPHSVQTVGVFMDHSIEEVESILQIAPMSVLQFHGSESPAFLERFKIPKIKVFAVDSSFLPESVLPYNPCADFFLFDAKMGHQTGGTGQVFDWNLIPQTSKPFFLAGGIGPSNVLQALQQVHPFAVDLNSKLESIPGIKDPGLVQQCVQLIQGLQ